MDRNAKRKREPRNHKVLVGSSAAGVVRKSHRELINMNLSTTRDSKSLRSWDLWNCRPDELCPRFNCGFMG